MDVSRPISSVAPSLDGPVLAALAGTTAPLRLAEVHRIAGRGSLSGVRLVLVRLVESGLVSQVPGGYVLNRDHVAAPAVQQLTRLWGEVFDRIRAAVAQWPEQPALVAMFGSAARRDGDEHSDIDLLVVSDAVAVPEHASQLAELVESWTGNVTRVVTLSSSDLDRMRDAQEPILANWATDLVPIVGDPPPLRAAS